MTRYSIPPPSGDNNPEEAPQPIPEGRFPAPYALQAARLLADQFEPITEFCKIVGSLRRRAPHVKDIELVILPTLAESWRVATSRIDGRCFSLINSGWMKQDDDVRRMGERYKRFQVDTAVLGLCSEDAPHRWIALEIFVADKDNFGNQLVIRTGPWDWNKALFAKLYSIAMRQENGYLRRHPSGEVVPCGTEQEFFDRIRVPYVPPQFRSVANVDRAWKRQPLVDSDGNVVSELVHYPSPAPEAGIVSAQAARR